MPKQVVAVEIFYDSAWHDIAGADDVRSDTPIVIRRGQGDETPALRPSVITCRLDNPDDVYRVTNPTSPLYGKAGRSTQCRVSVNGSVRGYGIIDYLQPDQSQDFRRTPRRGSAWADLKASGALQTITSWTQPPKSALRRELDYSGVTPAEAWPMEDPAGSQEAASAAGGGPMRPVSAVRYTLPDGSVQTPGGAPRFADGAGIAGSAPLPSFQGGGTLSAPVRKTTWNGYAIDFVLQHQAGSDDGGTASSNVLTWRENGTYSKFVVNITKGFVTVFHATPATEPGFAGSATAALDMFDGTAHHIRYQVRQNGGNYLAQLLIDSAVYATADNFVPGMTGTVGNPTMIEWNELEDSGDAMPLAAGHLTIWASGQIGGQPPIFNALNGYNSERTSYRVGRVFDDHSIAYAVTPGFVQTMPMGPQRPGTLPEILQECITTDDGLMFDNRDQQRIQYTGRYDRYRQTPVAFDVADLDRMPRETLDNRPVDNVVTANQREGGDYTARDVTGPLGTANFVESQKRVDVNVDKPSTQLAQVASWWLKKGTVELPRYPEVTFNMTNLPASVLAKVESLDIGSVMTLTGVRADTLRLTVLGYTETIYTHKRMITFLTAPDQQYNVGMWDATDSRWDAATSTIAYAPRTATTWTITSTDINDIWSTTVPYDCIAGGERVTVLSMSAASGTGPYVQTATVKRAVNGVVKDQTAGTQFHVFTAGRWALS